MFETLFILVVLIALGAGAYLTQDRWMPIASRFIDRLSLPSDVDGYELNRFAMAFLLAGLIAMIAGKGSEILMGSSEEGESDQKRGYTIAGAADAGSDKPAAPEQPVDIALYLVRADKTKGEETAKACQACHSFDKGGPNKVGPNLWGIVGAKRAHKDDFTYSKTIATMGGAWDYQNISEFITKPSAYAPGTKMGFAGLKDPQDRANVLAYLQTLSDSPVPFPAAKPVADTVAKTVPGNQPNASPSVNDHAGTDAQKGTQAPGATGRIETRSGKQTAAEPAKKPEDAAAEAGSKGVPQPTAIGPTSIANSPKPDPSTAESAEGKVSTKGVSPALAGSGTVQSEQAAQKASDKKASPGVPLQGNKAGGESTEPASRASMGKGNTVPGNGHQLPGSSAAPDAGVQGNDTPAKP